MKVLITGFEPFDNQDINPSWEAVKRLPDVINNVEIIKMKIPTVFRKSVDLIKEKIDEISPAAVVSVGQAGSRGKITVEFIGINFIDARIPDNEGNKPLEIINNDRPDGLFSTIPVFKIVEKLNKNGIPAEVSYTAGTFVCNNVLYGISDYIDENDLDIISGFIHVPSIYEQIKDKKDKPYMELEIIIKALEISLETIIQELKK